MPKAKEVSLELREKTVEAHDKGAISKRFTVSRTAVRCIIAKYKETNSVRNKPRRGRKRKISRTLERKIVRDVSKNPQTSVKMIVADLASSGVDLSRNIVVRALQRGGLQGHRPRRTPLLKGWHIRARLRLLAGCWLAAGWLLAGWLSDGCWLAAGWLLAGCWLAAGWLAAGWLTVT
ncbi:hypothetical protein KUCAC02_029659 [Chaenocephalus aceratus]|nr:hypothetical protein KUCAC02_029659 [Chaenocephalus aceratus]